MSCSAKKQVLGDTHRQSRISRTPYPQFGGDQAVTGGPKFSPVTTYTPKKASIPQIEIWSTRNQWSYGVLWKKSAYALQLLLAPVKARYLGIYTLQLLLGAPLKAKYPT